MRIPLAVDLQINAFTGASITDLETGITNGVVRKKGNSFFVTQRPTINVTEDASDNTAKAKGRGIFYWDAQSAKYIVNDDTVYKNSQANSIGTISSGVGKVFFTLLDDKLVIIDTENNEGWYVDTADNVTAISDTEFPPNATFSATLCHGAVALDGYLFVGDTDGNLYNSDNGSVTAWSALSFLNAEREPDGGVYVSKHHDHIVFYGVRTTEFFYNAGNSTGSPLNRRQDVEHTIGCADGRSVWSAGDVDFLVGTDDPGARRIYKLQNFQMVEISTPEIASFITQAIVKDSFLAIGSGFSAYGGLFYMLTLYKAPSTITPYITLVYDDISGLWYIWETSVNGLSKFPVIGWTIRTGDTSRFGEGVFPNGDLFTINDDLTPSDTLAESKIVEDGILEAGIVESGASASNDVTMTIRVGNNDYGSDMRKIGGRLRLIGNTTPNSNTVSVTWSDDDNASFSSSRTIDMTSNRKQMTRVGSFHRRNYQLSTSSSDPLRLEALSAPARVG